MGTVCIAVKKILPILFESLKPKEAFIVEKVIFFATLIASG